MSELEVSRCPLCKRESTCMDVTHSLGDYTRSRLYRVTCDRLRYAQSDCDYLGPIHTDADTAIRMHNALVAPETVFGKLRKELEAQPAPRTYEVARALTVLDMKAPLSLVASPTAAQGQKAVANPLAFYRKAPDGSENVVLASHYSKPSEYPDALDIWFKSGWLPLYAQRFASPAPVPEGWVPHAIRLLPAYWRDVANMAGVGQERFDAALRCCAGDLEDAMKKSGATKAPAAEGDASESNTGDQHE